MGMRIGNGVQYVQLGNGRKKETATAYDYLIGNT